MRFIIVGSQEQFAVLQSNSNAGNELLLCDELTDTSGDAIFYLKEGINEELLRNIEKPVFINSVTTTLAELNAGKNVYRINGWLSFLDRQTWEVAGSVTEETIAILHHLNIAVNHVPDETGLIAARVISMIINEGYFAVEESVSSKEEIDTAMKLGTNYPYGPFEWAQKIGLKHILQLLQKLAEKDERYTPSALLIKEATKQ